MEIPSRFRLRSKKNQKSITRFYGILHKIRVFHPEWVGLRAYPTKIFILWLTATEGDNCSQTSQYTINLL